MPLPRRLLILAFSLVPCGALVLAQAPPTTTPSGANTVPSIDKIDPPDWFTGLPSPMLLVHGQGLKASQFVVQGQSVSLDKTQTSENGHWAFLWIDTSAAAPQTLTITASNQRGKATASFRLTERSADPHAHRGFSPADAIYLLMTDRFAQGSQSSTPPGDNRAAPRGWHGGNFAGIEQHLDYLQQLGVDTIWTTPVASNGAMPESYHGYAATDLYAVDPHFGSLADYRHLSDALHARSMKLLIDLVPNHLGVQHPWVLDPPAPQWFHGTLAHHLAAEHDFYQVTDPHATRRNARPITEGWFTDAMPDLNQENPLVARYLIQNALWWVETANLDGIRLDTFPYVSRAFWHEFHAALHTAYPNLSTVGEVFHRDPEVTSFFAGGVAHNGIDSGLDTPFDFPVYFTLRDVLIDGKPMSDLALILRQDALYPHPERLVPFIGNHDTTRFFTDAHSSVPRLKLALGLVLTLRGTPQIYAGDEIGMPGGNDPDNRRDFPGGFAGDVRNAFAPSGRTLAEEEVFHWTSGLLHLRAAHTELASGVEQNLFADADAFAFTRSVDTRGCMPDRSRAEFLMVVNKAATNKAIDLTLDDSTLAGCSRFVVADPTAGPVLNPDGNRLHIEEPADSMTVYEVR